MYVNIFKRIFLFSFNSSEYLYFLPSPEGISEKLLYPEPQTSDFGKIRKKPMGKFIQI
jgi:hypothetical protein